MHPLLSDPWFAARLDAALAPYHHRFTRGQQAALRRNIAWAFSTHPAARRVLLRERPALAAVLGAPPALYDDDAPPLLGERRCAAGTRSAPRRKK